MPTPFIFNTARTPLGIGKPSGALFECKPIHLVNCLLRHMKATLKLDTAQIDDCLLGCATPMGDQGGNIAKASLLYADWDRNIPGMQVNRLGASGMEAIQLGAAKIYAGWDAMIIAGGIESMSRTPMESDAGALMFDPNLFTTKGYIPQGVAADIVATMFDISREEADIFALESHRKAHRAVVEDVFKTILVPIVDLNGLPILERSETPYGETSLEQLANLTPAFESLGKEGFDDLALQRFPQLERINHIHTAGNSSGKADGAAIVIMGTKEKGETMGLVPKAKIIACAVNNDDPTLMLTGSIKAVNKALKVAGLEKKDIDLWESGEAFAAAALNFQRQLGIDDDKFNINGGTIAFGHPIGATGAILASNLLHELEMTDKQLGCAAVSGGGGMGSAIIIERV